MSAEVSGLPETEHIIEIDGEAPPLITPGTYELRFRYHQTAYMFGRAPKLILWFTVLTFGEDFDVKLPRYYNVRRVIGKPARNGRFKVGHKSALRR